MKQPSFHGPVAVVAVAAGRSEPGAGHGPGIDGAVRRKLNELADEGRGRVVQDAEGASVVAFTTAPRAVEFAVRLHGELPAGSEARVGVHVGDVAQRDGTLHGSTVEVVEALAAGARPGETLLSRIAYDIVRDAGAYALTALEDERVVDAAPGAVYVALPATDGPSGGPGPSELPRRLVELLDRTVGGARLTLLLGPAGAGKTALARGIAELHPTVWLSVPATGWRPAVFARAVVDGLRIRVAGMSPMLSELAVGLESDDPDDQRSRVETLATSVADSLTDLLPRDLLVVVDGIDRLAPSPICTALLEALARNAPPDVHLLLIGRRDPGLRTERLGAAGHADTIDAAQLRLTDDEVASIAVSHLPTATRDQVDEIVRIASGHPETALLAAAWCRGSDAPLPLSASALARNLVGRRSDGETAALEALAALDGATRGLLQRVTGVAPDVIDGLVRAGLARRVTDRDEVLEVGAATAGVLVVDDLEARRIRAAAARELHRAGDPAGALLVLRTVDDDPSILEVLRTDGRQLLAEGGWPTVLDAVGDAAFDPALLAADDPDGAVDVELLGLIGDAWRLAGDRERALAWFTQASGAVDPVPAWLAWRMGMLLHLGGELDHARALYARAETDGTPADQALLHAWSAAAAWLQSDIETCRAETQLAMRLARDHNDDQALSAAHTVQAMLAAVEGDRTANDQHYLRALGYAERAGDVLQIVRIHTNRGSRLLEEGDHAEALAELEIALHTADLSGAMSIQGMAMSNRGQVLRRLGRLDEATADLVAARDVFERTGSRWVGHALAHLGEIYEVRGERALAQVAYEEALAHCGPVGDTQGTVPALAGLATLAVSADPDRARDLAEQACAHPGSLGHTMALVAVAESALAQGDRPAAVQANAEGMSLGRQRRDRPGLATHLELQARLADEPDAALGALREARDLWSRMDCPLETARVDVALAGLDGSNERRAAAEAAVRTLRAHGARAWAEAAEAVLAGVRTDVVAPVHVSVLGGLGLRVAGASVPDRDLPGQDARDLLAYLVVRGSEAGGRAAVAETLWPEAHDAVGRLELAVDELDRFLLDAIGTSALGGDPLVLDASGVSSDLARFRAASEQGLTAYREGMWSAAEAQLLTAEAIHAGTLLEAEAARPWLAAARDDVGEAYLQVVTALVDLAQRRHDNHGAVRLLLRVIERDPYDEGAHLRLVSCLEEAGRRGESRRRYRIYTARMQELGVEPAPFPEINLSLQAI